jgi:hypothetical protein
MPLPVGGRVHFSCENGENHEIDRENMLRLWRTARHEGKDNAQMQRMQAAQLQHHEEQEKHARPPRDEQILPLLPQTHRTQRDEVACERM